MARRILATLIGAAALACSSSDSKTDGGAKASASAEASPAKAKAAPKAADKAGEAAEPTARGEVPPAAAAATASEASSGEAPSWFSPDRFPHERVIRNDQSQPHPDGSASSALVLALAKDVTAEACMQTVREQLAREIGQLAEPTRSDDGRLTLQGRHGDYQYMVVCGDAKGQPTLFLSYAR